MADIIRIAEQFRAALLARDQAAAGQLVAAYGLAWTRLQESLRKVTDQIEAARARGEQPGISWLGRQERYLTLLRQVEQEILRLANFANGLITVAQRQELERGAADALAMLGTAAEQAGPAQPGGEIDATFNRLPAGAVEQIVGTLGDGSPLGSLLLKLPGDGKEAVSKALVEAIALGENPRKTARRVRDAFGGNLTRALRVARTEQLRAYRESTRATYEANSDRVAGWQWLSARQPGRTCASCWAMDGQIFETKEPLGGHPQCRCTLIAVLKSTPPFLQETGEEIFARLPAAKQLETLGPAKFAAYTAGSITLRDLVDYRKTRDWGVTRSERSLKAALKGEAPGTKWGKAPADFGRPEAKAAPVEKAGLTAEEARRRLVEIADKEEAVAAQAREEYDAAVKAQIKAAGAPDRSHDGVLYDEWARRRADLFKKEQAARSRFSSKARAVLYQDAPAKFAVRNRNLEPTWRAGIEEFRRLIGEGWIDDQKVIFKKIKGRASYGLKDDVQVNAFSDPAVIVHELGHWLEDRNKEIFDAVSDFLARRTKGEQPVRLSKFQRGYGRGEITKPDEFMSPYMGKVYEKRNGDRYASEIVSMGLQYFYEQPVEFARRDPDYFDFIYNLIRRRPGGKS